MAHKKPQRNKRKSDSHKARYGMGKAEWASLKRNEPQKALEIRLKAQRLLKTKFIKL